MTLSSRWEVILILKRLIRISRPAEVCNPLMRVEFNLLNRFLLNVADSHVIKANRCIIVCSARSRASLKQHSEILEYLHIRMQVCVSLSNMYFKIFIRSKQGKISVLRLSRGKRETLSRIRCQYLPCQKSVKTYKTRLVKRETF